MSTRAVFGDAQPIYAEHGIATFPVKESKAPAVRNYLKMGLDTSRGLVIKFPDAPAIGFATKPRNGVSILDIDTPDEKVLADALDRHGHTPLIARTGSGKFHAYYRHNGERRKIRPWRGVAIDLLGTGGFVVAPPSEVTKGEYRFIEGSLDDVVRLPVLRNLDLKRIGAAEGERNSQLWRHCMRAGHHVETFDELLDVARTFNDDCIPPMEDSEVIGVAQSAWKYTENGKNRIGHHGAWFPTNEVVQWHDDTDAFYLFAFLRALQGPDSTFMCANGLADSFGWRRHRLVDARNRLIEFSIVKCVREARSGRAAQYKWTRKYATRSRA